MAMTMRPPLSQSDETSHSRTPGLSLDRVGEQPRSSTW
jgi:hypothetical protein